MAENDDVTVLPDGSGFAIVSFPLQRSHWIFQKGADGFSAPPPMPFRIGVGKAATFTLTREEFADRIWAAAKYAVCGATMHGAMNDFDPDALCQNMVVGMLGYWTNDGLSDDAWANPPAADESHQPDPAVGKP